MAHHEPQDFVGFIQTAELARIRHLAAEDLRVVFARHHGLGSRDEGGEESVERLDVHRPAALAALEEVAEAVKLGVGQRLVLGESPHADFQSLPAIALRYYPSLPVAFSDWQAAPTQEPELRLTPATFILRA